MSISLFCFTRHFQIYLGLSAFRKNFVKSQGTSHEFKFDFKRDLVPLRIVMTKSAVPKEKKRKKDRRRRGEKFAMCYHQKFSCNINFRQVFCAFRPSTWSETRLLMHNCVRSKALPTHIATPSASKCKPTQETKLERQRPRLPPWHCRIWRFANNL